MILDLQKIKYPDSYTKLAFSIKKNDWKTKMSCVYLPPNLFDSIYNFVHKASCCLNKLYRANLVFDPFFFLVHFQNELTNDKSYWNKVILLRPFMFLTLTVKQSIFSLFIPKPNVKRFLASYTLIFVKNYQVSPNNPHTPPRYGGGKNSTKPDVVYVGPWDT